MTAVGDGERGAWWRQSQRRRVLTGWPDVPTKFLLCRKDRFFPADFMRRVVRERLGIKHDEIDSGHLPAISHPKELADRLHAYRTG